MIHHFMNHVVIINFRRTQLILQLDFLIYHLLSSKRKKKKKLYFYETSHSCNASNPAGQLERCGT